MTTLVYWATVKIREVTSHHQRGPYQSPTCTGVCKQPCPWPLWYSRSTYSPLPLCLCCEDLPPPQCSNGPRAVESLGVLTPPSLLGADWGLNLNWMAVRKLDLSHLCFSLNFLFFYASSSISFYVSFANLFSIILFLICWSPETHKMKEKQDSILLIQETV